MSAKEQLQQFLSVLGGDTFDQIIVDQSRIVSASKEESVFALKVNQKLCNALGTMHGGALATAIDLFTSAAIIPSSRDGFWQAAGVSRTLSVTYLRPAESDSEILFVCKLAALGKRTSTVTCDVVHAVTKKKLAIGVHDKVSIDGKLKL